MFEKNYATQYQEALIEQYPYVLYFGRLYEPEVNEDIEYIRGNIVKIPYIEVEGRTDADRDTITAHTRRHGNKYITKELNFHREWETLLHPVDDILSNGTLTIEKATKVYNQTQKFPEKDAYTVSKLYAEKQEVDPGKDSTEKLTAENILNIFDDAMAAMDEEAVPATGRILYVTPQTKKLIKSAKNITRQLDVGNGATVLNRDISRIDEVELVSVPSKLMKTAYNFDKGFKPGDTAKQINMMLVHPSCVRTPEIYSYSGLEAPSATNKGKAVYYEDSYEDVFLLDILKAGIWFNVEAGA